MQPSADENFIELPVTLDYKAGRSSNNKSAYLIATIFVVAYIVGIIVFCIASDMYIPYKIVWILLVGYAVLSVCRYILFKELYYSNIFETLKESDGELALTTLWKIVDVQDEYPYICFFKGGRRGIFVRMERGTITGKGATAQYDHFECISDAYQIAWSCNLDMIHTDTMSAIGTDTRMQKCYDSALDITNPDMQEMMLDIYDNLVAEESTTYSCYDVYLFLSRDEVSNFLSNVQYVVNRMVGGNYISYTFLNRSQIASHCQDLFNLESFDSIAVSKSLVTVDNHSIIPVRVITRDGDVTVINKTTKQKKQESIERNQKLVAARDREKINKKLRKKGKDSEELF